MKTPVRPAVQKEVPYIVSIPLHTGLVGRARLELACMIVERHPLNLIVMILARVKALMPILPMSGAQEWSWIRGRQSQGHPQSFMGGTSELEHIPQTVC